MDSIIYSDTLSIKGLYYFHSKCYRLLKIQINTDLKYNALNEKAQASITPDCVVAALLFTLVQKVVR